jgi:hypothetical protein
MRSASRRWPLVAVTTCVLILLLSACGSSANVGASASSTPGTGGSSSPNIQLSGALTGTLTQAANCTKTSDQLTIVITATANGNLYLFGIVATHYHGAGTYTTGTTEGEPVVNVNDESAGGNWVSQYTNTPGTIVVNAGETSGTVNATLVNDSDHSTVTSSGTWACA